MSAMDQQEDDANNVADIITHDILDEGRGDAIDVTNELCLVSNDSKVVEQPEPTCEGAGDIPKLLSPQKKCLDVPKPKTPDGSEKMDAEIETLLTPELTCTSSSVTQDNTEINQNVNITLGNPNKEEIQSIDSTSQIEQNEKNNLENMYKPITDMSNYKETAIDNSSDLDLELRWTDDDDSQMQSDIQPLSDEALKNLDKDLNLTDPTDDTEKCDKKSQNLDQDFSKITERVKVLEHNSLDEVTDVSEKKESKGQSVDNNIFKTVDQELNIAHNVTTLDIALKKTVNENIYHIFNNSDSDKSVGKSIDIDADADKGLDQTVEELQQLLDHDDVVDQELYTVKERKTLAEENSGINDSNIVIDAMNVAGETENQLKPVIVNSENDNISELDNIDSTDVSEAVHDTVLDTSKTINIDKQDYMIVCEAVHEKPKLQLLADNNEKGLNMEPIDVDTPSEIDENSYVNKVNKIFTKTDSIDEPVGEHDDVCNSKSTPIPLSQNGNKNLNESSDDIMNENDASNETENVDENIDDKIGVDVKELKKFITPDLNDDSSITTKHRPIQIPISEDVTMNENYATSSVLNVMTEKDDHKVDNTIRVDIEEVEEFITPDLMIDSSIIINTEHKVNKPDVMLHIPTQEFHLHEFDDSDMVDNLATSTLMEKDCSSMIEKTVTEIVNQLARCDEEKLISERVETCGVSNINEGKSKSMTPNKTTDDTYSNIEKEKQLLNTVKTTLVTSMKNITDTVFDAEISKQDNSSKNDSTISATVSHSTEKKVLQKDSNAKGQKVNTDRKIVEKEQQEKHTDNKNFDKDLINIDISTDNTMELKEKSTDVKIVKSDLKIEAQNENADEKALDICEEVFKISVEHEQDKHTEGEAFDKDAKTLHNKLLEKDLEATEVSTENKIKRQEEYGDEKDFEKGDAKYVKKLQKQNTVVKYSEKVENLDEKCVKNVTELYIKNSEIEVFESDIKATRSPTESLELQVGKVEEVGLKTAEKEQQEKTIVDKSLEKDLKTTEVFTENPKSKPKSGEIAETNAVKKDVYNKEQLDNKAEEKVAEKDSTEAITLEKDSKIIETSAEKVKEKSIEMSEEKDPKHTEMSIKTTEKAQEEKMDVQPSTSSADAKNIDSDNSDDVQEGAQDSLGLLAESSRVMDDDDDQEQDDDEGEDVEGEDEDDDDFDPEDEESSNQHSEESNPANSELETKDEGIDIVFNNEADSNDANDGFMADEMGDSTEITIEDNEPLQPLEPIDAKRKEGDVESQSKEKSEEAKKLTTERRNSILSELLSKPSVIVEGKESEKPSPDKLKSIERSLSKNVINIVDLEESSSEDDVKSNKEAKQKASSGDTENKLDKSCEADKDTEKSVEAGKALKKDDTNKLKVGEVFNLDSDEDDKKAESKDIEDTSKPRNTQCINHNCTSDYSTPYYLADRVTIAYYGAARRRKRAVCESCLNIVISRNQGLVTGIKDMRPLMSLRMSRPAQQLLEISDSDSEGDDDPVGEGAAKILEDQLAQLLNETWSKYNLDTRLTETEEYLEAELEKMDKQSKEIDELLNVCQKATDKLRVEFYAGFEPNRKELPALSIHDTPIASYACLETDEDNEVIPAMNLRYPKRRSTTAIETPAKKQALPTGYMDDKKDDFWGPRTNLGSKEEDKDISVVRLTAEAAPADLPPPGELSRPPLRAGAAVYAMKNPYGAWLRGKLLEVLPKTPDQQFTQCRVRFEHKTKNLVGKVVAGRCLAYTEPCEVRMTIGTRVIALFKNSDNTTKRQSFYYSGIIAEIPNPVNSYRYLIFFDDGYVQYVEHRDVRLVYESSKLVWDEVHPYSRDFVSNYLLKYPERPMVRMHTGQSLVVEYNGKWLETKVVAVDAALVKVQFGDNRSEWIYRGSTRLQPLFVEFQAARRGDRTRLPRSTKQNTRTNMPYVEYTRSDEQAKTGEAQHAQAQIEELRRQRAVAKKSTSAMPQVANPAADVISRVVFYTPKNSVRPYKMVPHNCGPQCKRKDLLSLKELRTYNPLTKPLLSGWERQIVRHKYSRDIMYRAPCGRRVRNMPELHRYLRCIRSDMPVDLFDFNPNTHCLAEFVLNKSNVQKKDLSHGKENVPIPCVNYYDHSLPEFCSYNTERTPTAGVPLNLDPEFLCGCDCDDDCADKTKCACWKMTLEGARTIGVEGPNIGYEYRRLPEPLQSGIYECNSRCKCKSTCLNRVVQNPLQLKLQVFKTLNRGWGIRALNDVPKGAFLCIYAGNLLTDATANLDGLNEGDEYLAELDYIEVAEALKEGYEDDVPDADKKLDKKESKISESDPESESTESEEEIKRGRNDLVDDDFQPAPYFGIGLTDFSKRLRRRVRKQKNKEGKEDKEDKDQTGQEKEQTKTEDGDDCITISDDEEVRVSQREPARFTAQAGMTDSKVISKYRSIRTYYGKDEACYIMDAKVQGNIGRYLNHSCSPNVFVQNVFVDTHDPRFPWVSFFALHHIRAGTELTWNYNYDIGSVPGKVLYCFCGAPNCRGRLL